MYSINKFSVIATTLLFLTFWGGIIVIYVLALIQIIMSIKIIIRFKTLNPFIKLLFNTYVIATISLLIIFKTLINSGFNTLSLMFVWIFVSMGLAYFHLYITYKIKKDEI